jgi:putative aminopeptidase FrvX
MDEIETTLKQLSEVHGVPGYEEEVAQLVAGLMSPHGEVLRDRIGSVICRQGEAGPKVMLAAHMDEIGFMVHHVSAEGFLRFLPLGGWWDQVLLGQRVIVRARKGPVPGVIGAKPPHLLSQEERKKLVELKEMYIDVGARSREEVEALGIRPGDPVVPDSAFTVLADGRRYMGKGFDDRVGLALMVELLRRFAREPHPNTVYAVATAMEEVGCRGAKTSCELVDPDVALVLEVDLCGDVPGIKPEESAIKLGGGPSIWLLDARMIPNLRLRDLVIDTAEELGIPLQFSAYTGAATDGAHIHMHRSGVPTVVLGVPTRHIHSHAGIISREDFDRAVQLAAAVIAKLDEERVRAL